MKINTAIAKAIHVFKTGRDKLRAGAQKIGRMFQTQQDVDALLTDAALANDLKAAETAIANGSRCDAYCPIEKNPALIAIKNKNDAMLQLMLDRKVLKDGASNRANFYEGPLLAHAIREGNRPAFDILIAAGADKNPQMEGGGCLVSLALQKGRHDMALYLINNGAPVDKQDGRGWTPLFWAAHLGLADLTRTLLGKNVRTYLRDNHNNHVLDVAWNAEKFSVQGIIQKHIDDKTPAWRKTSDDTVTHTDIVRAAGYRLTQIFNFKTSQHTHITHNLANGADTPVTKSFDALAHPELIAEAKRQLETLKA
jgi:ankyrin repeat protein